MSVLVVIVGRLKLLFCQDVFSEQYLIKLARYFFGYNVWYFSVALTIGPLKDDHTPVLLKDQTSR